MDVGGISSAELKQYVDRLERLEEEKKGIADDIKDCMSEMKAQGFDTKIVRKILKIRKQKASERAEEEALLEVYMSALGMLVGTPLGDHAIGAARKLVNTVESAGATMTIRTGDKSVTIGGERSLKQKIGAVLDHVAATVPGVTVERDVRVGGPA